MKSYSRPTRDPAIPTLQALPLEHPKVVQKKSFHPLRWAFGLLFLALVVVVLWNSLSRLPEVRTAPAVMDDLWTSFTAEGVVKGKEYPVGAEQGGRIIDLRVAEADTVQKGQVLFRLNADQSQAATVEMDAALGSALADVARLRRERRLVEDQQQAAVATAQAKLRQVELEHRRLLSGARPEEIEQAAQRSARARAALEEAEKAFHRADSLYQSGVIPRATLEKSEAAYKAAQADMGAAEAAERLVRAGPSAEQIEVSRASVEAAKTEVRSVESGSGRIDVADKAIAVSVARVNQARAALSRAQIANREQIVVSPANGTVTKLYAEPGTVLLPGTPALLIATRDNFRIEAEISTEDAPKVRAGMNVDVTAAGYPGQIFPAKVVGLMPAGELKPDAAIRTRIVRARIELTRSTGLFRPGMEVDIEGRRLIGKRFTVPSDAVRYAGERASVFLIVAGRVVERPVVVGIQSADRTEIISGLLVGDRVILRGKDELSSGDRVQAVN